MSSKELIGQQIEHYLIEGIIGEGGMGTVYRAEDLNLARPVAMKVMHPQFAAQPEFQKRFQQEAQAAARLNHPSIVSVYHFGRQHGLLYIVMELVPGLSLGAYIKQLTSRNQVVRLDETVMLVAQVADALGYAHRRGVIHRDVKPDNIIVRKVDTPERLGEPPLRAVVTDFGLAKLVGGELQTQSGEFMGTLAYVSPEQVMDKPLDGRSDVYSLGVVLYQLATGRLPFDVRSPSDAILKHLNEQPPRPQDLQPGLPNALVDVILRALSKRPDDRYQTGEEMAVALRKATQSLSSQDVARFTDSSSSSVVSVAAQLEAVPHHAQETPPLPQPPVAERPRDRLQVIRADGQQETYSLYKGRFDIGRSTENDIVLSGSKVSRQHAILERQGDVWTIIDNGSTNGTFIENMRLRPQAVQVWHPAQRVRIGEFVLQLEMVTPPPLPNPPQSARQADDQPTPPRPRPDQPPPQAALPRQQPAPRPFAPPPLEHITADMRPQSINNRGIARVLLLNKGDIRTTVTLAGTSQDNAIQFDAQTKQVTIAPGQKGVVDFYLEPRKRPFLGTSKVLPFGVHVSTTHREWDVLHGEVKARPTIPLWLILALFLLLVLLVVAAVAGTGLLF